MSPLSSKSSYNGDDKSDSIEITVERTMSFAANFETRLENDDVENESIGFDVHARSSSSASIESSIRNEAPYPCVIKVYSEERVTLDDEQNESKSDGINAIHRAQINFQQQQKEKDQYGEGNDENLVINEQQQPHQMLCSFLTVASSASDDVEIDVINESMSSPFSTMMMSSSIPWFSSRDQDDKSPSNDNYKPNSPEESDDDASVNSAAYFDPMDFDASNWVKASSMTVPTVGLAILAASVAITHPILFIVGALTAYGTATAAAKGYHYYFQNDIDDDDHDTAPSITSIMQLWCTDSYLGSIMCEENSPIENEQHKLIPSNNDADPIQSILAQPNDDDNNQNSAKGDNALAPPENDGIDLPSNSLLSSVMEEPYVTTSTTQTEDVNTSKVCPPNEDWIDANYPPLANIILKDAVFVGLNTIEFFRVFFDDDAPYNFKVFQEKRGDIDIHYGDWSHLPESAPLSFAAKRSIMKNGTEAKAGGMREAQSSFPLLEYHSYQSRTINFKARTNSFIGPPWATTKKTQRFLIVSKRLAILENRTDLRDIPFCDRFYIIERWVIQATKDVNRYNTHVTSSCEVIFTGSCTFESQIRSKSTATIRDVMVSWVIMATEALNLTERNKIERLNKSNIDSASTDQMEDDGNNEDITTNTLNNNDRSKLLNNNGSTLNDEAIEVTHNSLYNFLIVGDQQCGKELHNDKVKFASHGYHESSQCSSETVDNSVSLVKTRSSNVWRMQFRKKIKRPNIGHGSTWSSIGCSSSISIATTTNSNTTKNPSLPIAS